MDWKKVEIKAYFQEILKARSRSPEGLDGTDWERNTYVLLRNFEETVDFLKNASIEETGCAIDSINRLMEELPIEKAEIILQIFKDKLVEYPNVDDYSEIEYVLELKEAEETIEFRKNNK